MKKLFVLLAIAAFALIGCHNLAGNVSPTETYVGTLEVAGAVAPLAKVYLARLEQNGTLTGDKLVQFKTKYAFAKSSILQAAGVVDGYIDNPTGTIVANYPVLLQQFVTILADLTGGMIVNDHQKMRIMQNPKLKADKSLSPDEIILALNLVLMAVDKIIALYSTPEVLTADQKAAYHQRVAFVKSEIPDWN